MTEPTTPPTGLVGSIPRQRIAVCLLFLANGLYIGGWSAKIPELSLRLGLTPQFVGLLLVAFGVGSIVIMPIGGAQIAKFGSTAVLKVSSLLFLPVMLIITLAPNVYVAAVGVFLYGGFAGAMDIAMNANAVEVEKAMRRSIMSSCHAFWSLGALIGAATCGFLIEYFGEIAHAGIATAFAALTMVIAFPMI
uniref:MFS transporter n=1 Tax=uncultured Rhizobium sp. TaxID=155567 RepID=UPI00261FE67C